MSEEWLFVALLSHPVTRVHEIPVFIDPLAYVGIMNSNIEEFDWPQTATHDVKIWTPLDFLKESSQFLWVEPVVEVKVEDGEEDEGDAN